MIKMRHNKNENAQCCECGNKKSKSLDMFDVCIGGNIFTICDECNGDLFNKTLSAECYKNSRMKSNKDMDVIRLRNSKKIQTNHISINEVLKDD